MSAFALARATTALLLALAVFGAAAPAAVAGHPSAGGSSSARTAAQHTPLDLEGDATAPKGSGRTGLNKWNLRTLYYYESIPAKWDWSLSTAVAKWNGAGGGIRLVPTTDRTRAKLVISYGSTGGAAGMATVGSTRGAWVHLSTSYSTRDALDPWYRIEVMALFTHELGHVLGFGHTTATCSIMRAVLDVGGCGLLPPTLPGYYKCRTIDAPQVLRFITAYGGTARYPANHCLMDPLPSQLWGVGFSGGTGTPVTVRWLRPSYLPSGSRVQVRVWRADSCGAVPAWAETAYASPTALAWTDPDTGRSGSQCFRVNLVNRLGAGRDAVTRLVTLTAL